MSIPQSGGGPIERFEQLAELVGLAELAGLILAPRSPRFLLRPRINMTRLRLH